MSMVARDDVSKKNGFGEKFGPLLFWLEFAKLSEREDAVVMINQAWNKFCSLTGDVGPIRDEEDREAVRVFMCKLIESMGTHGLEIPTDRTRRPFARLDD